MFFKLSYIGAFLSLLLISCASKTENSQAAASVPSSLSQRLSESGGFKQDEDGNWIPKSDKRSSFELQRESPYFKGNIEKKAYQTGDYEKKSWWGKKTYEVSEYKGNTDASRFKKETTQFNKVSPFGDKKVDIGNPYKTNTLDYQSARESKVGLMDKPRNDYTESKRRHFVQPSVIEWQEQRKLSLDQSRSILGR